MTAESPAKRTAPPTWPTLSPEDAAALRAEIADSCKAGRFRRSPVVEIEIRRDWARFEYRVETFVFNHWQLAEDACREMGAVPKLLPIPPMSIEVLATAPALRVLT